MKFTSDIDIDMADRNRVLDVISHTAAGVIKNGKLARHASGIYVTDVPTDPVARVASVEYKLAEQRGYMKLDFLNVHVYSKVRNEQHLLELMREPNWQLLNDAEIVKQLIHLNKHFDLIHEMPEPINTIPRLAMFLALIRPAKRYLIGKPWAEVAKTIWEKDPDSGYGFKQSHSLAYAMLVVVHMNLLAEQGDNAV